MARDEILSKIKSAEAEARAAVQQALEEKERKIAAATTEAMNLVKSAETDAQDYYEKSVAKAESDVKAKKQSIIQSGDKNVASMSGSASAVMARRASPVLLKDWGVMKNILTSRIFGQSGPTV